MRKRTVKRPVVTVGLALTTLGAAAGIIAAAAASGGPGKIQEAAVVQPALTGPFVALGDSYAAGNLIPDSPAGSPVGCLRSTHNYSGDVAAAIGATGYVDAACSGATTIDMTQPQSTTIGTNPPQLNSLASDDSVVTLTIGGNDVGFSTILKECIALSVTSPFGNPCQQHYTAGGTDQLASAVAATGPKVAAVLEAIHARAPQARILLAGYPDILPSTGTGCWPLVPIAHGDVPYLRGTQLALNQVLAQVAAANGATFVDTYTATTGHDVCTAPGAKWIEGLVPTSAAYPFHPNRLGQQAMANQVLAALRS